MIKLIIVCLIVLLTFVKPVIAHNYTGVDNNQVMATGYFYSIHAEKDIPKGHYKEKEYATLPIYINYIRNVEVKEDGKIYLELTGDAVPSEYRDYVEREHDYDYGIYPTNARFVLESKDKDNFLFELTIKSQINGYK